MLFFGVRMLGSLLLLGIPVFHLPFLSKIDIILVYQVFPSNPHESEVKSIFSVLCLFNGLIKRTSFLPKVRVIQNNAFSREVCETIRVPVEAYRILVLCHLLPPSF